MKKIIVAVIFLFQISFLYASSKDESINQSFLLADSKNSQGNENSIQKSQESYAVPDWVKRTNFAVEAGTDIKPKYFLETVQPLLGTAQNDLVFFNQSRISSRDYRTIYNTGVGLRRIFDEQFLLGVNSFYDYHDLHQHHRAGLGFEAMTDKGIEARINTYLRVSNKRLVKDDGVNEQFEEVANGFDYEFGGLLPYLPFLKVYGGGNWYNFAHFKNKYGWKARMEYNPAKYSRLVFEMYDDTKISKPAYKFEGAFSLSFTSFALRDILNDLKIPQEAYPGVDLREKVLDRVIRDFDITVIKSSKSKATGLTVEGGRT